MWKVQEYNPESSLASSVNYQHFTLENVPNYGFLKVTTWLVRNCLIWFPISQKPFLSEKTLSFYFAGRCSLTGGQYYELCANFDNSCLACFFMIVFVCFSFSERVKIYKQQIYFATKNVASSVFPVVYFATKIVASSEFPVVPVTTGNTEEATFLVAKYICCL